MVLLSFRKPACSFLNFPSTPAVNLLINTLPITFATRDIKVIPLHIPHSVRSPFFTSLTIRPLPYPQALSHCPKSHRKGHEVHELLLLSQPWEALQLYYPFQVLFRNSSHWWHSWSLPWKWDLKIFLYRLHVAGHISHLFWVWSIQYLRKVSLPPLLYLLLICQQLAILASHYVNSLWLFKTQLPCSIIDSFHLAKLCRIFSFLSYTVGPLSLVLSRASFNFLIFLPVVLLEPSSDSFRPCTHYYPF